MRIARRSPFTGVEHVMDLPLTEREFIRINAGEAVQAVVPHLPADQREFLISGITPTEWEEFVGNEQD